LQDFCRVLNHRIHRQGWSQPPAHSTPYKEQPIMTFWQVADSSPEQWTTQRSLTVPSAMALGELIHQICTISTDKAHRIAQAVNQFKDVSAHELENAGLTQKQAAKLLAAIELGKRVFTVSPRTELITDPQSSASLLQYDLGYSALEKAAVLILNNQHRLISKEIIAIGSSQECIVDPRVVFERILRHQGSRFVLAHNHPSGLLDPSPEDIQLTKQFLYDAKLMNTPMLDHLIIGGGGYYSIRESLSYLWHGYEE
jgi:DNA repair protein RadC